MGCLKQLVIPVTLYAPQQPSQIALCSLLSPDTLINATGRAHPPPSCFPNRWTTTGCKFIKFQFQLWSASYQRLTSHHFWNTAQTRRLQIMTYSHNALVHRRIEQIWKWLIGLCLPYTEEQNHLGLLFCFVCFLTHFTHCYLNIACKYIITINTDQWTNMTMLVMYNGWVTDNLI